MDKRPNSKKRQAIVDASLLEFQDKGYKGANMDSIAERANVSKRTVYNYFPSKQALFECIAKTMWQQANQATAQAFDAQRPVNEQLIEIALKELALVSDQQFFKLTKMLLGELMNNESVAQEALAQMSSLESNISIWMQQAHQAGVLNIADADEAGKHFHGLIKVRAFWPQLMGEKAIPKDAHLAIAEQATTMFLSVYGPK